MNLRNLEQIQEDDSRGSGLPWATLLLAAVAGGAIVVATMTTFERDAPPAVSQRDPLDEMLAKAQSSAQAGALVADQHVTFPGMLSDHGVPTTAMAAVKDERGRLVQKLPQIAEPEPPESSLPKAPRPVGDLLTATPVTKKPQDQLSKLAFSRSGDGTTEVAPAGVEGGYEIQVASFRDPADADAFADELRKRGHRAYRQAAYVPDRGLWHRVRIGPFKAKYQAKNYKLKFERSERISTFLVDPEKVKRQKKIRDAKVAAQKRREERKRRRRRLAN